LAAETSHGGVPRASAGGDVLGDLLFETELHLFV
jgi:hypothetical protein